MRLALVPLWLAIVLWAPAAAAQATVPVSELARQTHFHGLAVDPADPQRLFLATHHGFFAVTMDGRAQRLSRDTHDFMGFTPSPDDPSLLFASGHPASGGNLGFMTSRDGGKTWRQLSPGHRGPVDFHQMDVSRSDPNRIYGVFGGLQMSRDGGKTWQIVGPVPPGMIDLAVSPGDADILYAGTEGGLFVSRDAGRSWTSAGLRSPVSLIQGTPDGGLYLFAVGQGLLRQDKGSTSWRLVSSSLGARVVLHLAAHPTDPQRLFLADQSGGLLFSNDAGASWRPLDSH